MGLRLVTPPAEEPLTLAEAKLALRVTHDDEDALIGAYLTAARLRCEAHQRRAYLTQTWELSLDRFPCATDRDPHGAILLPRPPTAAIVSVTYTDPSGAAVTMDPAAYVLKASGEPARLVPAYGTVWPTTRCEPEAVRVRYTAGIDDSTLLPETWRQAIRFLLGHYYQNRESVVTGTIATEMPEAAEALLAADSIPAALA